MRFGLAETAEELRSKQMYSMLWIMRHADAGPTTDAKDDDLRPLSEIGITESECAGQSLKALNTPIQCCLTSTLKRASQTADIVCGYLGVEPVTDERLNGPPVDVRELIKGRGNCLIVGHDPSVSLMVYRLTGAQIRFSRGGLAQIHEGELWTLLNPSDTMLMAGHKLEVYPQDVNKRSADLPLTMRSSHSSPPRWRV